MKDLLSFKTLTTLVLCAMLAFVASPVWAQQDADDAVSAAMPASERGADLIVGTKAAPPFVVEDEAAPLEGTGGNDFSPSMSERSASPSGSGTMPAGTPLRRFNFAGSAGQS